MQAPKIVRRELETLLANVVELENFVFTAGCIADDESLDVAGQTRQALADVDRYLMLCGSDRSHIVHAVIWLADIRYRDEMNAVWTSWVDPGNLPSRACIESRMASPGCLVEIAVVAERIRSRGR